MDQVQNKLLLLLIMCLPHGGGGNIYPEVLLQEQQHKDLEMSMPMVSLLTCRGFLFCAEGQTRLRLTTEAGSEPT